MFKIFKDLAREPLAGRPDGQAGASAQSSGGESTPAAPVNSSRLATPSAPSPAPTSDTQASLPSSEADDDPEALQVVGLVHALQHDEGLMQYVEVRIGPVGGSC